MVVPRVDVSVRDRHGESLSLPLTKDILEKSCHFLNSGASSGHAWSTLLLMLGSCRAPSGSSHWLMTLPRPVPCTEDWDALPNSIRSTCRTSSFLRAFCTCLGYGILENSVICLTLNI
uniref:Uncharacterized protein n=1 Tax=Hyaloperonospora arabidopsidis (strain Emoy2) TaxID=559515 RepID=M4BWT9_HYAAE